MGYRHAGFCVTGVDKEPQPNYPFECIQDDVLQLTPGFLMRFDAIHASPPCQAYSSITKCNGNDPTRWPRLIGPVRDMLKSTRLPWVIENVVGTDLLNPTMLCGTMFPALRVIRHRLFESTFVIDTPAHKKHPKCHTFDRRVSHFGKTCEWQDYVQVTGGGNCSVAAAKDAMGIDWMSKAELNQAIPPAYTHHVGKKLRQAL